MAKYCCTCGERPPVLDVVVSKSFLVPMCFVCWLDRKVDHDGRRRIATWAHEPREEVLAA